MCDSPAKRKRPTRLSLRATSSSLPRARCGHDGLLHSPYESAVGLHVGHVDATCQFVWVRVGPCGVRARARSAARARLCPTVPVCTSLCALTVDRATGLGSGCPKLQALSAPPHAPRIVPPVRL